MCIIASQVGERLRWPLPAQSGALQLQLCNSLQLLTSRRPAASSSSFDESTEVRCLYALSYWPLRSISRASARACVRGGAAQQGQGEAWTGGACRATRPGLLAQAAPLVAGCSPRWRTTYRRRCRARLRWYPWWWRRRQVVQGWAGVSRGGVQTLSAALVGSSRAWGCAKRQHGHLLCALTRWPRGGAPRCRSRVNRFQGARGV